MNNTLTITAELAHEIIRSKYNLPDTFSIVIEQSTKVEENQSDDWIYVSANWCEDFAPPETDKFNFIEVQYDDDTFGQGHPESWDLSWNRNCLGHITKYRPVCKDD